MGWRLNLRAVAITAAVAALVTVAVPGTAAAKPAKVKVGVPRIGENAGGRAMVLVPISYPIELAGHAVKGRITVEAAGDDPPRNFRLHTRVSAGPLRAPERRGRFTYVHSVPVGEQWERQLRRNGQPLIVNVAARARLDADRDGEAELESTDRSVQLAFPGRGGKRLCGSVPGLRTGGARIGVALPACTLPVRSRIAEQPEHGSARIVGSRLQYDPEGGFRGSDAIRLNTGTWITYRVGNAAGTTVRAIGDSVTAGFGYYDNGKPMPFSSLLSCKPAETFYNDACSSNSPTRSNTGKTVVYAPDYGLANNVSWAAQWANEHGIVDYENLAVSGSEPSDWLPGGQLYATAKRLYAEDPDYLLMTVGANPLLSEMLFGIDNMGCAVESDITGGYRECIEEAFASVRLRANLKALYSELVANTGATVYLMQYHLSVPAAALAYSATQIAMMGALLNEAIAAVAAEVSPQRLQVIAPPHFDVGIDISPVFPSEFSCSRFGYTVDGPSVQSDPSQDELELGHPLSFCSGPPEGPPWVISGDTGIHPSAAGYAQMASRLPPPG
jgi:lysophospholipase L1-like esterase